VAPERVRQIIKCLRAALKRKATVYRTKQMMLDELMAQEGDSMGQVAADGIIRVSFTLPQHVMLNLHLLLIRLSAQLWLPCTCFWSGFPHNYGFLAHHHSITGTLVMQLGMNLGVDISHPEALAVCTHHGFNTLAIPFDAMASILLSGTAAKVAAEAPTKREPFSGTSAPTAANCKISYKPCKTPVFTPTNWPRTADTCVSRSASLPDARLHLEFVYGYAGFNNAACNLFYNCHREVLLLPNPVLTLPAWLLMWFQ
jgi:hypothetical protein